jgi:flagellar biogenesis protein FliO
MTRFWKLVCLIWLASLPMWAGDVCAADPQNAEPATESASSKATDSELQYSPQWPEPPNTGAMLLRLCLGTVIVLVLCVGSLWLGKPWLQKFQLAKPAGQGFQIEGTVALGNRAVLYLVKVGETQLVAGTDATGLKSLIALPASFKEVLEEQGPVEETSAPSLATPFELRLRTAAGGASS